MQLATDTNDYAAGSLGLVELASVYLNDKQRKQFSKSELVEHVNNAQLDIADEINGLYRDHFLTSATTPIVGGQAYYSLPTDLVSLMGLEVIDNSTDREPNELVQVHISDRRFYEGLERANLKTDYQFYFVAGTAFKVQPEAAGSSGSIRIHYVKRLARLVNNADVSTVPENGHELMSIDAAKRALVKLGRVNGALNSLRRDKWESFKKAIIAFRPQMEMRVEPWYGSYGPESIGGKMVID